MNLSLDLASSAATLGGLEWTINYSTSDIASLDVTSPNDISCTNGSGTSTCVMWTTNSNALANGSVATLAFTVSGSTKDTSSSIQFGKGVAVSEGGSSISTSTTGTTISLTAAPVITSATTASGTAGTAFSYQITASNSPASYGVGGLPAGLSLSTSTGLISGTPTAAGTSNVTLSATNSGGTGTATLTLTIAGSAPVITSATTANGTAGKAFSYQITASNSPTSYSATGLPAGLSVNTSSGLISGTPTAAGTSSVALSATNSSGTGTATLTLTIAGAAAPVITSATTASGTAGAAFSYQITASNSPTSYSATGLPSGLSLNASSGLISGTPTAAGTSTITLGATNSSGTGHATLTLTLTATSAVISFVQATAKANTSDSKTLAVSFSKNTVAGDIVMVGFDFDAAVTATITDSQGNTFTQVGKQLVTPGGTRTQVYYAQNIKGGADKVTITLSAKATVIECYLAEYSGVSQTSPIDAQAGVSGTASAISSGNITTTLTGDLIYGYSVCDSSCTAGSGFTARSTLDSNLIEDKFAAAPGSYAATATANSGWTMQVVALKP